MKICMLGCFEAPPCWQLVWGTVVLVRVSLASHVTARATSSDDEQLSLTKCSLEISSSTTRDTVDIPDRA